MTSVLDLVGAIQASLETLAKAQALTVQANTALSEAETALVTISRGSNSYKLTITREALAAATAALQQAETAKTTAANQISEYVSAIGSSGAATELARDSQLQRDHWLLVRKAAPYEATSSSQTADGGTIDRLSHREARPTGIWPSSLRDSKTPPLPEDTSKAILRRG